jgi:hypothetical protein
MALRGSAMSEKADKVLRIARVTARAQQVFSGMPV